MEQKDTQNIYVKKTEMYLIELSKKSSKIENTGSIPIGQII